MKKIFILTIALLVSCSLMGQNRATFFKESFDNAGIPAGWTFDGHASNWSVVGTINAGGEPNELHLYWSPQFNGKTRIISPVIDMTGVSDLVIEFSHYLDNYSGANIIGIETTSDGGATWNAGWQTSYASSGLRKVSASISTSDVGSSTFQFCLFYQGSSYNINDWYFDNFELYSLENLDAAIVSINNFTYVPASNNKADFTIVNRGTTTIDNMEIEYQYGDLAPVIETFSNLNMASLASKNLSFTEETFLAPGTYALKVRILKVNGVVDDDAENNYMEKIIHVAITSGQRRVCIEHFTSSTCVPCVSVNSSMTTLLNNNPDKYGITKYQMSWPGSGDPYYTAEGGVRRTYYGVNAVPQVYFNGQTVSVNQSTFNTAYDEPAFVDIAGTFNVSGNNITVNFDVSSYITISEARVYAIVNEKRTTGNVGGNGETEFFHVMMKMLPDAQGTTKSFNAGDCESFSFTQNMSSTHVEEMSDLEVHVFVQNNATKYVYNSNFLKESTTILYPPENIELQDNGNGTVTVSWDAPPQKTPNGYNIYLNGVLIKENNTTTSYTETLTNPIGYQAFKVSAIYGTSQSAGIADFVMICPDNAVPTALEATQIGNDVVLTWTAPAGQTVDAYNIYLDETVLQGAIKGTTFTHKNAPEGVHTYGVASIISGCISDPVEQSIEVILCSEMPESFDAAQVNADVLLTWEAPNNEIDSYNVYFDGTLYKDNITETTYLLENPTLGEHIFGVTSVTDDCESEMITKTVNVVICSESPKTFDAVQAGNNVVLTWEAPNNEVDSYNIYLDDVIQAQNVTDLTYTFVDAPDGEHKYGISSITGECESEIVEKTIDKVGISEHDNDFKIYPNPANDYVKIEGKKIDNVQLYNTLGQLVKTIAANSNEVFISLSELHNGIYYLQIYSEGKTMCVKKIIISR